MRRIDDLLSFDEHEPGLKELMALAAGKGSFIDVGAHEGKYAIGLADRFDATIALEPHPWTFMKLRRNVMIAARDDVTVFGLAAWDREEHVKFVSDGARSRIAPGGEMMVPCVPLDTFQGFAGKVRLVKIDVEGAEGKVVRGMRKILEIDKPMVVIEMHDNLYGDAIRQEVELELECADYIWYDAYQYGTGLERSHYWLCRAR